MKFDFGKIYFYNWGDLYRLEYNYHLFSALFRGTHITHCKSEYVLYFWVPQKFETCLLGKRKTPLEAFLYK